MTTVPSAKCHVPNPLMPIPFPQKHRWVAAKDGGTQLWARNVHVRRSWGKGGEGGRASAFDFSGACLQAYGQIEARAMSGCNLI